MLGYYQGSLLAELIVRDFGFPALIELVSSYSDGRDTPAAIRGALKIEPAELDRRLLAYVDSEIGGRAVIRPRRDPHGEELARARAAAGDVGAWLDVANACLDQGQRADADAALAKYLQAQGETPAAAAVLARRDLADGRNDRARERLERWAKEGTPDADGLVDLGDLQVHAGDRDAGIATLRRARELFPGDVSPQSAGMRLYTLLRAQGDDEARFALLEELVRYDEKALEARVELAQHALSQGRSDEAVKRLQEAAEIDPYRPDVRLQLADALAGLGRDDEARAQCNLVLALRAGQLPQDLAEQTPLEEWQQRAREKLAQPAPAPAPGG
jgi:tetratricopeptide (TPR) repeat protein